MCRDGNVGVSEGRRRCGEEGSKYGRGAKVWGGRRRCGRGDESIT